MKIGIIGVGLMGGSFALDLRSIYKNSKIYGFDIDIKNFQYSIDNKIIEINNHDDCNTVYKKIGIIVKKMYLDNIPKLLNNSYSYYSQRGQPTYYEKRVPEQGIINWT